jgi:hypothetical protein
LTYLHSLETASLSQEQLGSVGQEDLPVETLLVHLIIEILMVDTVEGFYCATSIGSFLLYSGFLLYVVWLLRVQKQKLDKYMKTTLTLIGVSNLFLVWQSADYIWQDDTIKVGSVDLNEVVQQTFEKVGILFDLARLSIILMSIKKVSWLTIRRINIALGLASFLYVSLGAAWEYVGYL